VSDQCLNARGFGGYVLEPVLKLDHDRVSRTRVSACRSGALRNAASLEGLLHRC